MPHRVLDCFRMAFEPPRQWSLMLQQAVALEGPWTAHGGKWVRHEQNSEPSAGRDGSTVGVGLDEATWYGRNGTSTTYDRGSDTSYGMDKTTDCCLIV